MTGPIVVGLWRRSALPCFFLAAMAQTAAAQGVAGSFEQLQILVKPGDTLIVTDTTGKETTGKIADLSASTLTLLTDGARRELRESDVTTIKQRRADSLANGAVIGLGVGAGCALALLWIVASTEDVSGSDVAIVSGVYAAIGTGAGVGIDALIRGRQVIYQRPSTSGVQFGIAPWLTRQRKGVSVTLRF